MARRTGHRREAGDRGRLRSQIEQLKRSLGNDGRAWSAVRLYMDAEHPDRFDDPSDDEINARRAAGFDVSTINVRFDDGN